MYVQPRPRMALRGGVMGAALAALGACAAVPSLPPAISMQPPQAYAAQTTFAAPAASWPSERWWIAYGDAQLDALIEEALAGSPDLAQARARVAKAEALAGQARSALRPSLTANGSYASVRQSYNNGIP